ncbi:MAG: hypothetical protein ACLUI3_08935 [Christensenellales bacterium]
MMVALFLFQSKVAEKTRTARAAKAPSRWGTCLDTHSGMRMPKGGQQPSTYRHKVGIKQTYDDGQRPLGHDI